MVFVDNDEGRINDNADPVVWHKDTWFDLQISKSGKPYLGDYRGDVH